MPISMFALIRPTNCADFTEKLKIMLQSCKQISFLTSSTQLNGLNTQNNVTGNFKCCLITTKITADWKKNDRIFSRKIKSVQTTKMIMQFA